MESENPQGSAPHPFPEGAKRPSSSPPPPPPPPSGDQQGAGQWNPGYQGNYWDRRADRWAARAQRRQDRWDRRAQRWGSGSGNSGGLFLGLFITALGLAFLLRNLDIVYFDNIGQYWPVILIAFGVSRLTGSRSMNEALPGLALTGVGALFLLQTLHILTINPWRFFWPGMLIFFGVSMLLRHLDGGGPPPPPPPPGGQPGGSGVGSSGFTRPGPGPGPSARFTGGWDGSSGGSDVKRLQVDLIFSGTHRKIISQEFEGGKVAAVFSGAEIDLREASIQLPEIMLHCDAVFGGIEVWVPQNWTVDVRGTGVFGAFHDQTLHRPLPPSGDQTQKQPRLVVKGGAIFGGVTIKN